MTSIHPGLLASQLDAAASAAAALSTELDDYRLLDDEALIAASQTHAAASRSLGTTGALIASEIARRSAPTLGAAGLAQRTGHRTPELFLRHTTGIPGREATTAVKAGVLLAEIADDGKVNSTTGEVAVASRPWLRPIVRAVEAGILSVAAADAIRAGLGSPSSAVSIEQLHDAARQLVDFATAGMDADALARRCRELRDEFDLEGVALREEERREQRSAWLVDLPNGLTRLIADLDPESAIPVRELFDRATSPKRGTVRFAESDKSTAESILGDSRSTGQLFADALVQLLKLGAQADPRFLLGSGAPIIRIAATRTAVETGSGLAHFEGQADAVSVATLQRLACEGRTLPVSFDDSGIPLDAGREHRLFTKRQREVLALKWGGCMADCDRPPSWCEAHHIQYWARDGGRTDIADGILLCRHHHLLFHNNGWEIARDDDGRYWVVPPREQDPQQKPVLLETKSRAMRDPERERRVAG